MNYKESSPKKKLNISPLKIKIKNQKIGLISPINSPSTKNRISKNIITEPNHQLSKKIAIPSVNINNSIKNFIHYSNIKYGIDESGNPMNIKDYYKSINDSVYSNTNTSIFSGLTSMTNSRLKRPIAYIAQDEKGNNILLDLKGNLITKKNKEGDYDFPLQLHVIIKDFDVKHPELRINGERNYNDNLEVNEEEGINLIKSELNDDLKKNELNDLINKNSNNKNKDENKFLLRTYDILRTDNSQEKNRVKIHNNNYDNSFENFKKLKLNKILRKNKSFISSEFGNKSFKKIQITKSKEDLILNNNNNKRNIDDIINNLKKIFCLKNNKNDSRKIINKNEKINIDYKSSNKNESNKDKNQKHIIQHSVRLVPRKRNNNLLKNKDNYDKQIENRTNKYFIMKKNKSFINDIPNQIINIKDKNKLFQKVNKSKIIPKDKNNIYIDLSRTNKIYNKNNINNNININKNPFIEKNEKAFYNKLILNKIKRKIHMSEKNKNNEINKNEKYYILSREADNMVKSYSLKKLMNENKIKRRNITIENELLYANNSYNYNYSKFSPNSKYINSKYS